LNCGHEYDPETESENPTGYCTVQNGEVRDFKRGDLSPGFPCPWCLQARVKRLEADLIKEKMLHDVTRNSRELFINKVRVYEAANTILKTNE